MSSSVGANESVGSSATGRSSLSFERLNEILSTETPDGYTELGMWFEKDQRFHVASYHYAKAGDLYQSQKDLASAGEAYLSAIVAHFKAPALDREEPRQLWTKYIGLLWKSDAPASQLSHFYQVHEFDEFSAFVRGWDSAYRQRLMSKEHFNNEGKDTEIAFVFYSNAVAFLLSGKPDFDGVERFAAVYFQKMRQLVGRERAEHHFLDFIQSMKPQEAVKCARAWDLKNAIRIGGPSSLKANDSRPCLIRLVSIFKEKKMLNVAGFYESRLRTYRAL